MRRIEVVTPERFAPQTSASAAHCRLAGSGRRWLASPPDASIWMDVVELEAGSALRWERSHGEEALFVERGEVVIDGGPCPAGGALVVEAHAGPSVEARVASRLLHVGTRDEPGTLVSGPSSPPPVGSADGPRRGAPVVHVVGPRGTFEAIEPGRETHFFADATCATCQLWLLYTARSFAYESPVHSHSQDELIHVLRGEIRIGTLGVGPGSTVFIAADQPYRFRAGDEGFAFLNYRRAASVMTLRATGEQIVENGAATGMTRVAPMDRRVRA